MLCLCVVCLKDKNLCGFVYILSFDLYFCSKPNYQNGRYWPVSPHHVFAHVTLWEIIDMIRYRINLHLSRVRYCHCDMTSYKLGFFHAWEIVDVTWHRINVCWSRMKVVIWHRVNWYLSRMRLSLWYDILVGSMLQIVLVFCLSFSMSCAQSCLRVCIAHLWLLLFSLTLIQYIILLYILVD